MTTLDIRNLDESADSVGLFTTLLDRFGALGGVELDLPKREEPARAADFLLTDRFAEGSVLHFGLRASFWLSGLAVAVLAGVFVLATPRRGAASGTAGPDGTRTRRPVPGRRTTRSGGSPRR